MTTWPSWLFHFEITAPFVRVAQGLKVCFLHCVESIARHVICGDHPCAQALRDPYDLPTFTPNFPFVKRQTNDNCNDDGNEDCRQIGVKRNCRFYMLRSIRQDGFPVSYHFFGRVGRNAFATIMPRFFTHRFCVRQERQDAFRERSGTFALMLKLVLPFF